MLFAQVVETSRRIAATTKRLEKIELLANLLRQLAADEIEVVVSRALEKRALVRENLLLREELEGKYRLDSLVGKSEAMERVFLLLQTQLIARRAWSTLAATKAPALVHDHGLYGRQKLGRSH